MARTARRSGTRPEEPPHASGRTRAAFLRGLRAFRRRSWPRWARLLFDGVLSACGIGFAVWRLAPTLTGIPDLSSRLAQLQWHWVVLAVVLSTSSLLTYGELHRRLLRASGSRLPRTTVQGVTVIGNAITLTVPTAGGAASNAYVVASFRSHGVELPAAVWVVTVADLASAAALVLVAPAGLAASGLLTVPQAGALAAATVTVVAGGWLLVRRPRTVVALVQRALRLARRSAALRRVTWTGRAGAATSRLAARMDRLRPTGFQGLSWLGVGLLGWLLDYAALSAFVAATVGYVPWTAVAVGYLAVQGSIALQLTPAGTGLAEAGLFAALIGGGVPAGPAALVVVLYRSMSWLVLAAAGWVTFAASASLRRSRDTSLPA